MIVDLYDDPRDAPAANQNGPSKRWSTILSHWETRGPITFRRVAHGMDADELFGFLGPMSRWRSRKYCHERSKIAKFYEGDEPVTRAELRKFYGSSRRSIEDEKALPSFFGFERTNFGIIHVRTDGERVLVFTHSGKAGLREAYRFAVSTSHAVRFAKDVTTG